MTLIRKGPASLALVIMLVIAISNVDSFSISRVSRTPQITYRSAETAITSMSMTNEDIPDPNSFREAEVLGLRLMQEGSFEEALVGTFVSYRVVSCHVMSCHVMSCLLFDLVLLCTVLSNLISDCRSTARQSVSQYQQ